MAREGMQQGGRENQQMSESRTQLQQDNATARREYEQYHIREQQLKQQQMRERALQSRSVLQPVAKQSPAQSRVGISQGQMGQLQGESSDRPDLEMYNMTLRHKQEEIQMQLRMNERQMQNQRQPQWETQQRQMPMMDLRGTNFSERGGGCKSAVAGRASANLNSLVSKWRCSS